MKHTVCFAALAALAASCNALAVGGIAEVTIIDRSTGVALTPYLYRGEYWVAGNPGATYAIEIRNHLGQRLLAVTAVDGVNVISGATAAWGQTGYVFNPGQDYRITGWRKSDREVAAFTFTAAPNSYAARTGRPANVGIIGVALFRERQPQEVYVPPAPQVAAPIPSPAEPPQAKKTPAAGQPLSESSLVAETRATRLANRDADRRPGAVRRRAGKRAAAGFFNTPARLPGTRGLFRARHAIPEVSLQIGRTGHDAQTRYRPWRAPVLLRNQHRVRPHADST